MLYTNFDITKTLVPINEFALCFMCEHKKCGCERECLEFKRYIEILQRKGKLGEINFNTKNRIQKESCMKGCDSMDTIESKILNYMCRNRKMKRSEIVNIYCKNEKITTASKRYTVQSQISNALTKLESKGLVYHVAHGYWETV